MSVTHYSLTMDPAAEAPLPITRMQALHKAADMKRKGWTWTAIAMAMGEYHGHWLCAGTWRTAVNSIGLVVPKREMTPAKWEVQQRAVASSARAAERRRLAARATSEVAA
jgi:hypothetical protein